MHHNRLFSELVAFFFLLILSNCDNNSLSPDKTVTGNGQPASVSRAVGTFTELEINGSITLHVQEGADDTIHLSADENLIDLIVTSTEGKRLRVYPKKTVTSTNPVTITCRNNHIERYIIRGNSDIDIEKCDVARFSYEIEGNGTITVAGAAKSCALTILGNTVFNGADFITDSTSIYIEGEAEVIIAANVSLDATIFGIGTITYIGDPAIYQDIYGVGTVTRMK